MSAGRIHLYDTTLRDGAQTQDVDFSVADKIAIAADLDRLGVDYVEGGFPGANPTDDRFFAEAPDLTRAVFTAFGMTRRPGRSAANDPGLAALFNTRCKAVCLVGKSWDFHVDVALGIPREENLELIRDSIRASREAKGEALFDAEHFFDGYRRNPDYAVACIRAAYEAGARWVVLCDTNGGTLPDEVEAIVAEVIGKHGIPGDSVGIHCHNDTENAVANSLAAVRAGARMVQGTINGLGERCGNANLVSLIPTLMLKMGYETGIKPEDLPLLTEVSRNLDERLNRAPNRHQPYVGASAFAHKGGLHVSAVEKDPTSYEHLKPELVGNRRQIVVSDQAGRSNILARLREIGMEIDGADPRLGRLVDLVKQRDTEGYAYDTAEASFELLVRRELGEIPDFFEVMRFHVTDERRYNAKGLLVVESEAVVRVRIGNQTRHEVAEGNGPVNALDNAMRKALEPAFEAIRHVKLADYRVRILAAKEGTAAKPRVLIRSRNGDGREWSTLGVSTNIIEASMETVTPTSCSTKQRAGRRADPMTSGKDPNRPSVLGGPSVVLVEPQLGENIGACARAMLNCGLTDLRLVNPRDGWPNEKAWASASGADRVLDGVRLFASTADAVADLHAVYATTVRTRDMIQEFVTPRVAAAEMRAHFTAGHKVGVLFGPERSGLRNDDLTLAETLITVPLNPSFASLNLAQAVLLIGYEWFQTGDIPPDRVLHTGQTRPATKAELVNFFEHVESELDRTGFFTTEEKRPSMVRTLRNAWERMKMTEQEVRTFHGVIAALTGRRKGDG